MATYVPAKRATAFVFGVSLQSYANSALMKASPTLAAGDVKISKDGGAFANLTTLPTVTPAAGRRVEVSPSATEMTADNITIIFSDQTVPPEWCDLAIHIQTAARQIDDLAYPATSGRSMVVDAAGLVDSNSVKHGPSGAGTAQTARDIGASVLLSAGSGTGQLDFTSGVVKANATQWLGGTIPAVNVTGVPLVDLKYTLGTISPATAGSVRADSVTGAVGSVTGLTASDVGAIKTKTDFLPSATAGAAGGVFIAGTNAATVVTTSFTTTFTGNLTGSVGSVSGAVGSVTGNVGGNVTGTVGSVVGAVGSVAGNVGGNVTGTVASVVGAVGSVTGNVGGNLTGTIGGLTAAALKDFFDTDSTTNYAAAVAGSVVKEIASNAAGSGLDAAATRAALGMASANLDTQLGVNLTNTDALWDLLIGNAPFAGGQTFTQAMDAIKAKTTSLTFTVAGQVDANIQYVNDVLVTGNGSSPTWGP